MSQTKALSNLVRTVLRTPAVQAGSAAVTPRHLDMHRFAMHARDGNNMSTWSRPNRSTMDQRPTFNASASSMARSGGGSGGESSRKGGWCPIKKKKKTKKNNRHSTTTATATATASPSIKGKGKVLPKPETENHAGTPVGVITRGWLGSELSPPPPASGTISSSSAAVSPPPQPICDKGRGSDAECGREGGVESFAPDTADDGDGWESQETLTAPMGRVAPGVRLKLPSSGRGTIVVGGGSEAGEMRGGAAARGGGGAGVGVVTAPRLKQPFNPAAPTFGSNLASIEGVIKEIIDYNESNGFTVCILRASEVVPILDTRDIIVVGSMPRALPGEEVVAK
eukprot:gene11758-27481_t